MLRTKITEVGKLKLLDDGGLVCSVISDQPPSLEPAALAASIHWASPGPGELAVGDLVAYPEHGVARYRGRKSLDQENGEKRDYLVLEYAQGGHLYVPVDRSDFVQKLGSVDCAAIKLSTLAAKGSKGGKWPQSYCVEVLPNAYEWPGIGTFPELPQESTPSEDGIPRYRGRQRADPGKGERDLQVRAEWYRACATYQKALHANASYRQAAHQYFERQSREPQALLDWCWVYRTMVVRVGPIESANVRDRGEHLLLVKQYVLRREREVEKLRREVETLENCESLEGAVREPIPENVRLFVWRRDKGQCVRCGSRERLEFDHIIPVVAGGSNTERNIQLLCESCNRSKSATVWSCRVLRPNFFCRVPHPSFFCLGGIVQFRRGSAVHRS
jgi:hypothetical protein